MHQSLKLPSTLSIIIIVSCLLLATKCSDGENLSNVFVLDTSDSDSAPISLPHKQQQQTQYSSSDDTTSAEREAKAKGTDEENTRIITDNEQSANMRHKQSEQGQRDVRNANNSQYSNGHNSRSQTTTRPRQTTEQSAPKTEERLLVSITTNDNDEDIPYSSKPERNPQSSSSHDDSTNSGYSTSSSSLSPQQQKQKRQPSITISIQDAGNINKQISHGGGNVGGTPAVILRPGEDGQSIVIATVNSNTNSHTNKYNQNKPQVDQILPTSSSTHNPSSGHHNNEPYREPVNNPIQSIINQHHITSTTRRPSYGEYGSSSSSSGSGGSSIIRPISTSLDDLKPPVRPISSNGGDDSNGGSYEVVRPPHKPDYETGGSENLEQGSHLSSSSSSSSKYELNERNCGIIHETKIVGGEEADPGDFMWMAAIVRSRPKNGEPRPFCGGSLITRRHILTAAHCLEGLAPRDVLVRLGSYDFDDNTAASSSADYAIDQFRVPANYSKKTHVSDIAIMRLKTPLSTSDNYKTVCMPQLRRSYVGALGTVTGYGSQSQTFRRAAPKLRQVTVPIWENRKCSTVYKRNLTDSFLCAGYEEGGKDACQGDSGGPLMTEGPGQKMMIVGVVSHGIGCGAPGYPGVYTRTTTFMDWIDKNTRE